MDVFYCIKNHLEILKSFQKASALSVKEFCCLIGLKKAIWIRKAIPKQLLMHYLQHWSQLKSKDLQT